MGAFTRPVGAYCSGKQVYFGLLELHPVCIEVSFSLGTDLSLIASYLPDMYLFGVLKSALLAAGTILSAIDRAPIEMSCFIAHHVFESQNMLLSRITNHYTQEVRSTPGSASPVPAPTVATFLRRVCHCGELLRKCADIPYADR